MVRKKKLALLAALLLAMLAGYQYGFAVTLFCVVLLVTLLGALSGLRYALAHAGLRRLEAFGGKYHISKRIAALESGKPCRFVVLGDNRNALEVPLAIHKQVKTEDPAFMFNTGDLVRFGTARELLKRYVPLLEIMDPIPIFSVPGNHDRGAREDFAAYRALLGEEQFSFDYGDCRFVGENNSKRKRMTKDDLVYLHRELSKSPIQYKFVFIHIPPAFFEDGIVTVARRRGFKKRQDEFRALMTHHQVTEVFMAHIHGYATKEVDGVRYTLTAGAGAPLSKGLPQEAQVHHYVLIETGPQGLKREVVRWIGGEWIRGV